MNWAMNWKGGSLPHNLGKRLTAILLVGSCVGLVFWSVTIRLALVTQAQSQMHSPFSLTRELEKLRTSWSQEQADALTRDWKQFQAHNFRDYDQVVQWITRFSTRAQALGFQVAYKIGEEGPPVSAISSIKPFSIEFSLQTQSEPDGYNHFVGFMKEVTESDVSVTLDKIELSGTGRGVQKLDLILTAFMNQKT